MCNEMHHQNLNFLPLISEFFNKKQSQPFESQKIILECTRFYDYIIII